MTTVQRGIALIVGMLLMLGMVALSRVPVPVYRSTDGLLRVAMSARPERVEVCRAVSDSELANTPEHMRQRNICEGVAAAYLLEVMRNNTVLASDTVRGGGLRNDRQLYVLKDFTVPSGVSNFEVRFRRIDQQPSDSASETSGAGVLTKDDDDDDGDDDDEQEDRERTARARRAADAVPRDMQFRETVTLSPREILLVTYDRESRTLRSTRAP